MSDQSEENFEFRKIRKDKEKNKRKKSKHKKKSKKKKKKKKLGKQKNFQKLTDEETAENENLAIFEIQQNSKAQNNLGFPKSGDSNHKKSNHQKNDPANQDSADDQNSEKYEESMRLLKKNVKDPEEFAKIMKFLKNPEKESQGERKNSDSLKKEKKKSKYKNKKSHNQKKSKKTKSKKQNPRPINLEGEETLDPQNLQNYSTFDPVFKPKREKNANSQHSFFDLEKSNPEKDTFPKERFSHLARTINFSELINQNSRIQGMRRYSPSNHSEIINLTPSRRREKQNFAKESEGESDFVLVESGFQEKNSSSWSSMTDNNFSHFENNSGFEANPVIDQKRRRNLVGRNFINQNPASNNYYNEIDNNQNKGKIHFKRRGRNNQTDHERELPEPNQPNPDFSLNQYGSHSGSYSTVVKTTNRQQTNFKNFQNNFPQINPQNYQNRVISDFSKTQDDSSYIISNIKKKNLNQDEPLSLQEKELIFENLEQNLHDLQKIEDLIGKPKKVQQFLKDETYAFEIRDMRKKLEKIMKRYEDLDLENSGMESDQQELRNYDPTELLQSALLRADLGTLEEIYFTIKNNHGESSRKLKKLAKILKKKPRFKIVLMGKIEKQMYKMLLNDEKPEIKKFIQKNYKNHLIQILKFFQSYKMSELNLDLPEKFQKCLKLNHVLTTKEDFNCFFMCLKKFAELDKKSSTGEKSFSEKFCELAPGLRKSIFYEFEKFFKNEMKKSKWRLLLAKFSAAETRRLKKKLTLLFGFQDLKMGLKNLNQVNLGFETKEVLKEFKKILPPAKEEKKNCFKTKHWVGFQKKFMGLLIGKIKRGEKFDELMKILAKISETQEICRHISKKFLAEWFLSYSNSAVRFKSLPYLASIQALPLFFQNQKVFAANRVNFLDANIEMATLIPDAFSVLSLSVGERSSLSSDSAKTLNHLFYTKFDESQNNIFSAGTVDINLDFNFQKQRNKVFLNCYGEVRNLEVVRLLKPISNLVIVHIHYEDFFSQEFKEFKTVNLIKGIISEFGSNVIIAVNDNSLDDDFDLFVEKKNDIKEALEITEEEDEQIEIRIFNSSSESSYEGEGYNDFEKEFIEIVDYKIQNMEKLNQPKKLTKHKFLDDINQIRKKIHNLFENEIEEGKKAQGQKDLRTKKNFQKIKNNFFEERDQETEIFRSAMEKSEIFMEHLNEKREGNGISEQLHFTGLFRDRRELVKKIRNLKGTTDPKEKEKLAKMNKNLESIELQIRKAKVSDTIEKFYELVMDRDASLILMKIVPELRELNEKIQKPLNQEIEEIKRQRLTWTNEKEYNKLTAMINQKFDAKLKNSVSIEVLFRNLTPYIKNNSTFLNFDQSNKLTDQIINLMLQGFAIELVDGENLDYKADFLIEKFEKEAKKKGCVIPVLGPQSSGKSTMLNFMFGTQFHTSMGRCTSGMYVSIQEFRNPSNEIKWLIIIDTEGLHSSERSDPEYDRKLCSFIMTISDIILVTVKGEMSKKMRTDLEITLYMADKEIRGFEKMPEIYFIMNQNDACNRNALMKQIGSMNENIQCGSKRNKNQFNKKQFKIEKEYVFIFGSAFNNELTDRGEILDREQLSHRQVSEKFGQDVGTMARKIFCFIEGEKQNEAEYSSLGYFFRKARKTWRMVDQYSDLTEMKDVNAKKQAEFINQLVDDKKNQIFKNDLDPYIKDRLAKISLELENYTSKNVIENKIEEIKEEELTKLKNKEKQIENLILDEKTGKNWDNDIFNKKMRSLENDFLVRRQILRAKLETLGQDRILRLFNLHGPEQFYLEAEKFRDSFDQNQKISKAKIENHFNDFFENFLNQKKESLGIEDLEENKFRQIWKMANHFTAFLPSDKETFINKKVSVQTLSKELENFILTTSNSLRSIEKIFLNLNPNLKERLDKSAKKFFDISSKIDFRWEITYINPQKDFFMQKKLENEIRKIVKDQSKTPQERKNKLIKLKKDLKKAQIEIYLGKQENMITSLRGDRNDYFKKIKRYSFKAIRSNSSRSFKNSIAHFFKKSRELVSPEELQFLAFKEKEGEIFNLTKIKMIGQAKKNKKFKVTKKQIDQFMNPSKHRNTVEIMGSMEEVVRTEFNFSKVVKQIKNFCQKEIFQKSSSSEAQDFKTAKDVTPDLLKNVIYIELETLIKKMQKEMKVAAVEVGSSLYGFLVYIVISFLWDFWVKAIKTKYQHKISEFKQKRPFYRNVFFNRVQNNKEKLLRDEMEMKLRNLIKTRWHQNLQQSSDELVQKLKQKNFDSETIIEELNRQYLESPEKQSFESIIQFIECRESLFEEKIEKILDKNFKEKARDKEKIIKQKLERELSRGKFVLEILKECLLNSEKKDRICNQFRIWEVKKSEKQEIQNYEQKREHEETLGKILFEVIRDIISGKQPKETFEFDSDQKKYSASLILTKVSVEKINFEVHQKLKSQQYELTKTEEGWLLCENLQTLFKDCINHGIYQLGDFLDNSINVIEESLKKFTEQFIGLQEFGVESIFQKAKKNAYGCLARCEYCNKKCEKIDCDGNHWAGKKGHMPRFMAGGHIMCKGKKLPSLMTCESICKTKKMRVNGEETTWEKAIPESSLVNWQFEAERDLKLRSPDYKNYEKLYKFHGKKICEKKGFDHYPHSIERFIKDYNTNDLEQNPTHFIICIDESGSMRGTKFENALKGAKSFVEHLKSTVNQEKFRVSLLLFNSSCRVQIRHNLLKNISLSEFDRIECKGGCTCFSNPLKESILLVKNLISDNIMHRIYFYTDGLASYPKKQIKELKKMIKTEKIDIKLHYITEFVGQDDVFKKIIKELGSKNCTLESGTPPVEISKTFIEIFNNQKS